MKNELETILHLNSLKFLLVDIIYRQPHFHFDTEIAYVLEGQGIIRIQEKTIQLKQGQTFVCNPCQVHSLKGIPSLKLLIVQFPINLFEKTLPQFNSFKFSNEPFLIDPSPLLHAATKYFSKENSSPFKTLGFLSFLLDNIYQNCGLTILNESQQNKALAMEERIQNISTYIHKNFERKISLKELAEMEGLTRTYFSSFFKENFGMSLRKYLDILRCEKACELLKSTNENLLAIAYDCGYADTRTFNNAFKSIYGVSPKEFRKNNFNRNITSNHYHDLLALDNQTFYNDISSMKFIQHYIQNRIDDFTPM